LLLTAAVAPDEPLISLPRSCLLRGELAYSDPDYGCAFEELRRRCCDDDAGENEDNEEEPVVVGGGPLDSRAALVLLVAIERCRGAESRWGPYIAALPTEYDDPAWWSSRERMRLRGTRLGAAADRYDLGLECTAARLRLLERLLKKEQREQRQSKGGGGPLSRGADDPGGWGPVLSDDRAQALKAARWARSVVWSRAFGVVRYSEDEQLPSPAAARPAVCLLPVLDMADHHPDARVAWHLGEDGRAPALEFSSRVALPAVAMAATAGTAAAAPATMTAPLPPPPPQLPIELFNNYGISKPTEELVLAYGFDLGADYARRHDGFLVSVALGSPHAAEEGGGDRSGAPSRQQAVVSMTPDAWDDAVGLQLRVVAAAGMPRDILLAPPPPSSSPYSPFRAPPLPPALLDLLMATAGAPDYALLHAGVGGLSDSSERRATPRYADSPPAWRMAALAALETQLDAKRRALEWAQEEEDEVEEGARGTDGVVVTPEARRRHARMARSYALGQLARLDEALFHSLPAERERAAFAALAGRGRGDGEGGGDDDEQPLPSLTRAELARAGLCAEWLPDPSVRFVREPWSLTGGDGIKEEEEEEDDKKEQQQESPVPPTVGLLLQTPPGAAAAVPATLPLLRLPFDACVAVPLLCDPAQDDCARARVDAEARARSDANARLISAVAERLLERAAASCGAAAAATAGEKEEEGETSGEDQKPTTAAATAWLWASTRADAADGLRSAAAVVAAAAADAAVPLRQAASAAATRRMLAAAGAADDDFARRYGSLVARGLELSGAPPQPRRDEGEGAWRPPPTPQTAAQALRSACFAHASLLVSRGSVLVAEQQEEEEEEQPPRSWLVLAPVFSRVGGAVLATLPLNARVAAATLTVSLRLPAADGDGDAAAAAPAQGSRLLFGARTAAVAEGRLAAEVAAEFGLAAAFSGGDDGGAARLWPAPLAGAAAWSRQTGDDDAHDDMLLREAGERAVPLRQRMRRVLAACCSGAGELLLPPPAAGSQEDGGRAERLVLADMLSSMVEDATGAEHGAAERLLLRSSEAGELLAAQAALGGGGNGGGGEGSGSSIGAASGLPSSNGSDPAAAAEQRFAAARRAFADMCWRELPAARVKQAAAQLSAEFDDAVDEARRVSAGVEHAGAEAHPVLIRLAADAWFGAQERTLREWGKEVARWGKGKKKEGAKTDKKKKKKTKRRDDSE
jgi:hypothetical protein